MAAFSLKQFMRRWEANRERYRKIDLSAPFAEELELCKFERYALLREIVIRLSGESVIGAGARDAAIAELIAAARLVAQTDAVEVTPLHTPRAGGCDTDG